MKGLQQGPPGAFRPIPRETNPAIQLALSSPRVKELVTENILTHNKRNKG